MKANIAYKFELMPTREQKRIFAQAAGWRRFVWNKAIELQKRCLEQEVPFLKYTELARRLVLWKKEDDMLWLLEAPSQALQQCLMDASAAIQAFKAKKKGFPKFQARGDGDSFRIPQVRPTDWDEANGRVRIPKAGFVRFRKSRPIQGKIKQMTVSVECGHWFVSVVTEMDFANDGPRRPGEVGIDLGIAQTVTLSDGTVFQLDVESIKKHEKQIAVLQRQLCRNKEARQKLAKLGKANPFDKREPSRMRRRLKAKIQNHHRCIRNIRRDFMLKTAHTIAQNYGWVAMEDLKLKNMTKSAKGTVEEPGKNVRQKTGLNRSLARVAPYAMRMAIHWAVFKANGRLILVDPKYTSQTCPICGYTSSSNRPSQAHFGCQKCGYTANADVVGAANVLKKSRTGSVRPCSELGNKTATGTVLFVAS